MRLDPSVKLIIPKYGLFTVFIYTGEGDLSRENVSNFPDDQSRCLNRKHCIYIPLGCFDIPPRARNIPTSFHSTTNTTEHILYIV